MVNTDFTIQTTYLYTQPITVDKLAVENKRWNTGVHELPGKS